MLAAIISLVTSSRKTSIYRYEYVITRYGRYHYNQLTVLETTDDNEAAITPEGLVVFASECEWELVKVA